ncbi:MAG: geranylgeranylglycerol-phosphate geranylgeranyltransferase [Ferruginibacter sp.]
MEIIGAFFRLIRWPNLVFIALTQCLFFFCVFDSVITGSVFSFFSLTWFLLLMTASVFIAAAGYIINDYFDMHIDTINKPDKVVVDKIVKRRWAIVWHFVLSAMGVLISLLFSWKTGNWIIASVNILCVFLLWFYSTTFKKKLLVGNIIISALTAWVILVIYFANTSSIQTGTPGFDTRKFFKFTALYAGFAFIISLIREVIKDLEDKEGDARYNCATMPIMWGVPSTKVFTGVWLVVSVSAISLILIYAWQLGWKISVIYCIVLIVWPLILVLQKLNKAVTSSDYHKLSTLLKFIILAGILSMLFFLA